MSVSFPTLCRLRACYWACTAVGALTLAGHASAQNAAPSQWTLSLSPFTQHWHEDPAHRHVYLAGLERTEPEGRFMGVSLFRNSFGQPAAYAYRGWQWQPWGSQPALYAKLSVGVIYGYLPPYNDKVPLNYHGFSPGLIPALGYRLGSSDAIQVNLLGTAGFMLAYNHDL